MYAERGDKETRLQARCIVGVKRIILYNVQEGGDVSRKGAVMLSLLTVPKGKREVIKSQGEKQNPPTFTFSQSRISHL